MLIIIVALFVVHACIADTIPATPENITVTFLTPTTVRVSWQTKLDLNSHSIEKYIVTYKPTDDRVVQDVAGNSEAVILDRLSPSTQYSIAVTAIWLGKKYRSRQIVFRTLDMPKASSQQDLIGGGDSTLSSSTMDRTNTNGSLLLETDLTASTTANGHRHKELPPIRGVEVGIVLVVLMVWAGAIALFFNRWGKIRMLLPYQPDYKHEQLKVPGTGVCSGGVHAGQHSHQFDSSDCGGLSYQPMHRNSRHFHFLQEEPSTVIADRCTRSRINSAIFVSSEGKGFDSIEFLRRHGSQSVLCRKARSAENITEDGRKRSSFCDKNHWMMSNEEDENDPSRGTIELTRCHPEFGNEFIRANNSAPIKTLNMIVGSVSIETPPSHIKDELNSQISMFSSDRRQISNDSSENETIPLQHKLNSLNKERSHSPIKMQTSIDSPKTLNLKAIRPKNISLPMVSVSEPSPPNEEDCL